jgi:microcystin-dependent protein
VSEPFVGEIRMFAGNFAPRGWAFCDGQLLAVSQNDALFSLLGTLYGGDGTTTFGLPDLRGRLPMHAGNGPGLTARPLASSGGEESVTLSESELPAHTHTVSGALQTAESGTTTDPAGAIPAVSGREALYGPATDTVLGDPVAVPATTDAGGGSASHPNMPPYLGVHFIIALVGIFPSRT